jgi:hypothetical protein
MMMLTTPRPKQAAPAAWRSPEARGLWRAAGSSAGGRLAGSGVDIDNQYSAVAQTSTDSAIWLRSLPQLGLIAKSMRSVSASLSPLSSGEATGGRQIAGQHEADPVGGAAPSRASSATG